MNCFRVAPTFFLLMTCVERATAQPAEFDIAPFARRCCVADQHTTQVAFDYEEATRAGKETEKTADGRYVYGLQWAEERDIKAVHVGFLPGQPVQAAIVEYWFREWPYPPPQMPTVEDPVDDPWQGKWLKAVTQVNCRKNECSYTFAPLQASENPRANNLPGVDYRRTLKVRLVFSSEPRLDRVEVFSGSVRKPFRVRIELGAGDRAPYAWEGSVRVYNGALKGVELWKAEAGDAANPQHFIIRTAGKPAGLLLDLVAAQPTLPGSEDVTIVTLEAGDRTFSFATPDVEKAPVYVPDFHAYVALASDARTFSPSIVRAGEKIRARLAKEPEQTYERASREIPSLDPVERQGGRLYLPMAADASWQKFAFEWGGNITISKIGTKAKGLELKRLEWQGDRISWRLGTGGTANYRPVSKDSMLSVLYDYLPVATARWTTDGVEYTEEGFATLLSGPLAPDDPARNEETPAVLMLKLTAHNPAAKPAISHLWLATRPAEKLGFRHGELTAENGALVRARLHLPESAQAELAPVPDGTQTLESLHVQIPLAPNDSRSIFVELPFIPRLSTEERSRLAALDYDEERTRVVNYWRDVTNGVVPFGVPESRFNSFAKAVIPHMRISATKDPKSGLYMVPAASYNYQVFANEAVFQCVTLDALGQHRLAEEYLEGLVRLQGSKPFDGTFVGDQHEVYHGARVDADYDYTASEYNLDHGAVLWALGEHYFYTRDQDWLRRTAPSMEGAADWVASQRKLTEILDGGEKIPEYGLLPAGHLEDNGDWGHWFSVNAFAAAGMTRLAQALADIGAPEASRYREEAEAYHHDLREAVRRAWQMAPVIRLRDNTYVPYVPTRAYQRIRLYGPIRVAYYSRYGKNVLPTYRLSETREVLYGPMILLALSIFNSQEPIADWVLDDWEDNATMSTTLGLNPHGWVDDKYWFSRGGMVFQANLQNPILVYLRRNEIPAEIRNLYNDFVACHYPTVNAFTEEYRQWRAPSGPFYKIPDEARFVNRVRDILVHEDGDALWLAAGVPRRWLAPGQALDLHNAPTYFGPMSYRLHADGASVEGEIILPRRNPIQTAWLVVRVPEGKLIRTVEIDGKSWSDFDPAQERIRLPLRPTPMHVVVRFESR